MTILSAYCRGRIKSMFRPNDMNVNSVKLFFENVANLAKKKDILWQLLMLNFVLVGVFDSPLQEKLYLNDSYYILCYTIYYQWYISEVIILGTEVVVIY
jgi:hypothetical protein